MPSSFHPKHEITSGLPELPVAPVRVPRPDRVGLKPMTVRVDARTWRFFKKLAPDLETTQEKLLRRALALFMSKFRGVPESENQAVWEAIEKEITGKG